MQGKQKIPGLFLILMIIAWPATMMAFNNKSYKDPGTIELTVEKEKDQVKLNWLGKKDTTISHYTVEKSSDGKNFKELAILMTTDEDWNNYQFSYSDRNSKKPEKIYYRLRLNNKNGTINYSTVQSIR